MGWGNLEDTLNSSSGVYQPFDKHYKVPKSQQMTLFDDLLYLHSFLEKRV